MSARFLFSLRLCVSALKFACLACLAQNSLMRCSLPKGLYLVLSVACVSAICAAQTDLEKQFQQPPQSARPQTWWHWVSGNVSSQGITADLHAMKDIGLGGCQLFTVDQSAVQGPVKFMSPEWRGLVKQALAEADPLGLEFAIEGCDGWCESGGPWIQPSQGMQHVVWTEKNVSGGQEIALDLPQAPATRGFYRDIALLAFPTLDGDDLPSPASLRCNVANVDASRLIDGNPDTGVDFKLKSNTTLEFDLTYAQPVTCSSLTVDGDFGLMSDFGRAKIGGDLEVSTDGIAFKKAGHVSLHGVSAFPQVTGTHFRLAFPRLGPLPFHLNEIWLGGARVDQWSARVGMQPSEDIPFTDEKLPADEVIDPAKIVDLTGKAKWNAPPGRWTLIRLGHTGTGGTTHPSQIPGLECDKLSRAAVLYQFEHMFGPIFADSPNEAGRALRYILLDSWECGCANWTPLMPQEFSRHRGYNIKRWLPVFTGRVVKDSGSTQKFLWDLRRTIADLLTENHYGVVQEFAHKHHMGLCSEAPGIGLPTIADNLGCKGRTDIPMGEFWVNRTADDNVDDPKEAASAAHIYGKPLVATESFTSSAEVASWANDPYELKQLGDLEFCLGVNRFIFHRYAHQPWNDRVPGMSMGPWGINFERSNTWWKQASAWVNYLARCQYLLQQGRFVADLLYFYGEGAPARVAHRDLKPEMPAGFDYDVCNAEILLSHMSVDDGEIVLHSGMRYRVLVLPETDRMTLPVLKKIQSLVRAGAVVYGPKPAGSPSLSDTDRDGAVQKLADKIWGDCDGTKVTSHNYGKGRVLWGAPLIGALSLPDFSASQPMMNFIHRRSGETEIYFVSNQQKKACTVDCTFRVSGKTPELWHPDSGRTETAALYRATDEQTTVPIRFDPFGSVFVVFRKIAPADQVVSVSLDRQPLLSPEKVKPAIDIQKATFGVLGDPSHSRDVTIEVKQALATGVDTLAANDFSQGGPSANGGVRVLTVNSLVNGRPRTVSARVGDSLSVAGTSVQPSDYSQLWRQPDGSINIEAFVSGDYEATLASGKRLSITAPNLPAPLTLDGAWQLSFPPKFGAPATAIFDHLMSWTESTNDGIKYFSGSATYEKEIEIPAEYLGPDHRLFLDLGAVKNLAEITVNGKPLGVLWKEPFRVDITEAAKVGTNQLEIRITNLWPNRMIGDQKLPENERITWASVQPYKADSPLLPSGLLGPVRIIPAEILSLSHP